LGQVIQEVLMFISITLPTTPGNDQTARKPGKENATTKSAAEADLCWPTPLSAAYSKATPWTKPQDCEIEGVNGSKGRFALVSVAPAARTIQIMVDRTGAPLTLSFSQFKCLTLKEPIYPLNAVSTEIFPDIENHQATAEYQLKMPDGSTRSGLTLGYVESSFGLFVFTPVDELGALERSFFPSGSFVSVSLSDHLKDFQVDHSTIQPVREVVPLLESDADAPEDEDHTGSYLAHVAVTTPEELMQALDHQSKMPMIRLGDAMMRLGFVTADQLQRALSRQHGQSALPLGELMIHMGFLMRRDLNTALARKMGYPVVDVTKFPIEPKALEKVPMSTARRLKILPLISRSGLMVVAAAEPTRHEMLEELEFLLRGRVIATLGDEKQIDLTISHAYEKLGLGEWQVNDGPQNPDTLMSASGNELLESMELQDNVKEPSADTEKPIAESDNTLVRLINTMIIEANSRGVSDIHVESQPRHAKVRIRFRKDGLLSPYLELPHTYRAALVARLKIMADLDISERRKPQDGKIDFRKFSPRHRLELRIATIPTANGLEDVVMRLLSSAKPMSLEKLGMTPGNLEGLRQAVSRPYGMVLCVGPTGSGKTTTLHSVLDFLNTPERKIWTAEDPIEITQPALRQVQINPKIDWTFAKALRSFLRADPDIIMVGEIRDAETAKIAIEASLTGHLLLSTLHTNSAAETVTRLIDMGMDPFNFADSLLAVLAQRLTRRLCKKCRVQEPADETYVNELLDDFLRSFPEAQCPPREGVLAQWISQFGDKDVLPKYHAPGCNHCQGSGMSGRVGLHELLTVTPGMRRLIQTNAHSEDILVEAFKGGKFRTLRQDGILKVLGGLTSIDEVRANSNA
jgi:type II secretory ATPase GspE/PulE/Tfp pilus assembly ATPase PilB-like protein